MEGQVSEEQMEQINALKKMILLKFLDKEAYERMGRVRLADPNLALQIEMYLIQLFQSGQMKGTITDEKLKEILNSLVQKKQTRILRR